MFLQVAGKDNFLGNKNCATMQGFADRSKQRDLKLVLTDFVSVP
jgi:hypothetical protein